MAGERRIRIHEVQQKLAGVVKAAKAPCAGQGDRSHLRSRNEIYKAAGISESTGKTNVQPHISAFSQGDQEKLAKACGFSVAWVEWIDPDGAGRDTAEAFLERLKREWRGGGRRATGGRSLPCEFVFKGLMMIDAEIAKNAREGGGLDVNLELAGGSHPVGSCQALVRICHVEMVCPEDARAPRAHQLGDKVATLGSGSVGIEATGTSRAPVWRLALADDASRWAAVTAEAPLCVVERGVDGGRLTFELRSFAKNLQPRWIEREGGQALTRNQQRILERAALVNAPGGQEGLITLCRQEIILHGDPQEETSNDE